MTSFPLTDLVQRWSSVICIRRHHEAGRLSTAIASVVDTTKQVDYLQKLCRRYHKVYFLQKPAQILYVLYRPLQYACRLLLASLVKLLFSQGYPESILCWGIVQIFVVTLYPWLRTVVSHRHDLGDTKDLLPSLASYFSRCLPSTVHVRQLGIVFSTALSVLPHSPFYSTVPYRTVPYIRILHADGAYLHCEVMIFKSHRSPTFSDELV